MSRFNERRDSGNYGAARRSSRALLGLASIALVVSGCSSSEESTEPPTVRTAKVVADITGDRVVQLPIEGDDGEIAALDVRRYCLEIGLKAKVELGQASCYSSPLSPYPISTRPTLDRDDWLNKFCIDQNGFITRVAPDSSSSELVTACQLPNSEGQD